MRVRREMKPKSVFLHMQHRLRNRAEDEVFAGTYGQYYGQIVGRVMLDLEDRVSERVDPVFREIHHALTRPWPW